MENKKISYIFSSIADILELQDANVFRTRAYRTAAQNISNLSRELKDVYDEDPFLIDNIPGIGKDLKEKIIELVTTGNLIYYDEIKKEFPPGFLDMLDLSGMGPKKLKKLKEELGIENVNDLEKACKRGELAPLDGMGAKTQDKFLKAIEHYRKKEGRMLLSEAYGYAEKIVEYLAKSKNFKKIEKAGSLRRGKETVGDVDILVVAKDNEKAMDYFVQFPGVELVIAKGKTKASIQLKDGPQVDLRVIDASCFGAALVYFTGSKQHNVKIRTKAKAKSYKISEYGVFRISKAGRETMVAGKTEKDLYEKIGMEWIPPELREDTGEVEAALKGELPKDLISPEDIKGDLHIHTVESDGRSTIEEIVRAAKAKGYQYLAITDHSKYVRVANGMDEKRLIKHIERIRKVSKKVKGIKLLAGCEVDILPGGVLDFKDNILKELDLVIVAIHSGFALDDKSQTERLLRALDNKYVNILAHPSGRLIAKRSPIEVDFDSVFKKAAENNIFLEINTHGERIDLNDANARRAKELGAKFVISTDAHETEQMDEMMHGVITARRAWLSKKDVLNTYTFDKMVRALKK